ncbi:hypothetical protein HNQ56_001304 [Anaerotaenia torta]|uniref:hypothetical protein n=1 Tax=Anaerotaenia torta TaxID=433293 RepID=UPI003D1C34F5
MKKYYLLILIVSAGLLISSPRQALAATGLSEAEEILLDKLGAGVEVDGETRYIPVAYLNQIENELIRNKTDLTMEQAEAVAEKWNEVSRLMEDMDIQDVMNVQSPETALKLLTLVSEAASEIGYSVTLDLSNGSVNITDPEGEEVYLAKNTIKQTGFEYQPVLIGGRVLLSVFAACIFLYAVGNIYLRWKKTMKYKKQPKKSRLSEEEKEAIMERLIADLRAGIMADQIVGADTGDGAR